MQTFLERQIKKLVGEVVRDEVPAAERRSGTPAARGTSSRSRSTRVDVAQQLPVAAAAAAQKAAATRKRKAAASSAKSTASSARTTAKKAGTTAKKAGSAARSTAKRATK